MWLKSRFLPFSTFLAYRVQDCSHSGRSRKCSWIEWTLLPPLIPLIRPGSQFHVPGGGGGDVRTPFVIVLMLSVRSGNHFEVIYFF